MSLRPLLLARTPSGKPDQLSAGDTRVWWVGVLGSRVARAADCRLASLPDHTTHAWLLEVSLGTRLVKGPCLFSSLSLHSGVPPPTCEVPQTAEMSGSERAAWRGEGDRGEEGVSAYDPSAWWPAPSLPRGLHGGLPGTQDGGCPPPKELGLHTKVP